MSGQRLTREDVERIIAEARRDGRRPDLRWADLSGADLRWADLREADLRGANLREADLREADLRGAIGLSGVVFLSLSGLPSGLANLWPTPDGWRVSVGCWAGTVDDLATLIEGEEGWPEANAPEERALRRPGLRMWIALCRDHIARHPDVVPELVRLWGVSA